MNIKLITFCGVDYDLPLLPHFIQHYYALGIDDIAITLQSSDNQANIKQATHICKSFGIDPYDIWIGEYTSQKMHDRRLEAAQRLNPDWIIHADIDEFHEWPDKPENILASTECNAVQGVFVDRVSEDGRISLVDPEANIQNQFPICGNLMKEWFHGMWSPPTGLVKMMAYRPNIGISRGGHVATGKSAKYILGSDLSSFSDIHTTERKKNTPYKVHHFKWQGDVIDKLKKRIEVYKRYDYGWWEQSQNFLNYLESNNGIINVNCLEKI